MEANYNLAQAETNFAAARHRQPPTCTTRLQLALGRSKEAQSLPSTWTTPAWRRAGPLKLIEFTAKAGRARWSLVFTNIPMPWTRSLLDPETGTSPRKKRLFGLASHGLDRAHRIASWQSALFSLCIYLHSTTHNNTPPSNNHDSMSHTAQPLPCPPTVTPLLTASYTLPPRTPPSSTIPPLICPVTSANEKESW